MTRSFVKIAVFALLFTLTAASVLSAQQWKFGVKSEKAKSGPPREEWGPAKPWKFAVMSDTQWIGADDGKNPGTASVDIIKQLNAQFIDHGVRFVVQVGDLVDQTGTTDASIKNSEGVRAAFAQELYNAGIGFFPVRGNHDSQPLAGAEFKRLYPQTQNGRMSATPSYIFDGITVVNPDAAGQPFPTVSKAPFTRGKNFSTPDPSATGTHDWSGLSYSFDFKNARFVLLDQFSPLNQSGNFNPYPNAIDLQQTWINGVLAGKPAGGHAFVFSHKGLITENHVDVLFGANPSLDATGQDAFITALHNAGVRYYVNGHDHMHDRSLVSITTGTPTDGKSPTVQNILCASDSSKFYTPGLPSNDDKYDVPAFGHKRQAQISQELHTVGYYIFTVDGPRLSVEYYSAIPANATPDNCSGANCEWLLSGTAPRTPTLGFEKAETFGYSLNGKEFQVCQAGQTNCNSSYTQVVDRHKNTTARILSGANLSTAQDFDGRNFIKIVDTGWADESVSTRKADDDVASDILTLWGMADLGSDRADVYTLSLTYDPFKSRPEHLGQGHFGLATRDASGNWVNAIRANGGGNARFVVGPWKPGYGLGYYGVDPNTKTAWAVINYAGDFAVAEFRR